MQTIYVHNNSWNQPSEEKKLSSSIHNTCPRPQAPQYIPRSGKTRKFANPLLAVPVINNGQAHTSNDQYLPISFPQAFMSAASTSPWYAFPGTRGFDSFPFTVLLLFPNGGGDCQRRRRRRKKCSYLFSFLFTYSPEVCTFNFGMMLEVWKSDGRTFR